MCINSISPASNLTSQCSRLLFRSRLMATHGRERSGIALQSLRFQTQRNRSIR